MRSSRNNNADAFFLDSFEFAWQILHQVAKSAHLPTNSGYAFPLILGRGMSLWNLSYPMPEALNITLKNIHKTISRHII